MKTVGILGGMSWESTIEYYRIMNQEVQRRLGGVHSARIVMTSVDFQEYADDMVNDRWEKIRLNLLEESQRVRAAGANAIVMATNTMHLFAEEIGKSTGLPVIHIADAVADAIKKAGIDKVGLIGTLYSMEKPFYRDRLRDRYGIEAVIPEREPRLEINRIIFEELCQGELQQRAKHALLGFIKELQHQGVGGVILGCTELPLIIKQEDVSIPVWDTMTLHALKAVDFMLA